MNDVEKFIRCYDAKMNPDSVNDCNIEKGWACEQCPYDISMKKFTQYLHENRKYALQTTEQRIFRKEKT